MRALSVRWLIALVMLWPGIPAAQIDYSHLLRIKISVSFDGERIDFDETIFCGDRQLGTLTHRPVTQVLPSHFNVSKPTRVGGLLSFRVSWILRSLGQSVWRPGKTPETEFKAPAEYFLLSHGSTTSIPKSAPMARNGYPRPRSTTRTRALRS